MDTTEKEIEMGANVIATKIKPPKEVKERIYTKIVKEFWMAILIFAYFAFLNYGYTKMMPEVYSQNLKICSILLILATIIVFEIAYKKDNGEIAIHGIELLGLGILTLFMPYVYICRGMIFKFLYSFSSMYIAIYYSIKALIVYEIEIKKYITNLSDVKEIVESKEVSYLNEKNERRFAEIRNFDEEVEQKVENNKKSRKKFDKLKRIIKSNNKQEKNKEENLNNEKIEEQTVETTNENTEKEKKGTRKRAPKKRKKKEVKSILALNRAKNKENGDNEND